MYEIYGVNYFETITYDKFVMDRELADRLFETLTKCMDCQWCHIIDAETGECVAFWRSPNA